MAEGYQTPTEYLDTGVRFSSEAMDYIYLFAVVLMAVCAVELFRGPRATK